MTPHPDDEKIVEIPKYYYSGKALAKDEVVVTYKNHLSALTQNTNDIIEMVEGMKKEHRQFECNGAHHGRGCYEDWCDMETCSSTEATAFKGYNQALTDIQTKLRETLQTDDK